jgi:hypothetical protein
MSHLKTNVDTIYTPAGIPEFAGTWHKLETPVDGRILPDGSNIGEAFSPIVECGIKPDVESGVVFPEESELAQELKGWKLISADCRGGKAGAFIPLHIPKKGYRIHQNRDLFNAIVSAAESVLGAGEFEIATVGTLGGYSQFFVSLAIKAQAGFVVGKGDTWRQFFNLNSSHNGMVSSNCMLSTVRVVCMNTVQASISNAETMGTVSRIKHTQNSESLVTTDVFAANLKSWIGQSQRFHAMLETLRATPMDLAGFRSFASGVFTNDGSDRLSTTSYNRVAELETLFARGKGNVGESRYDALNAFTEYFTSGSGVGNSKSVALNKRVASANFGRGNDWKLEAIRILSDAGEFDTCIDRGERFYRDKVSAIAAGN